MLRFSNEILHSILAYLSDRKTDICSLRLVSRQFNFVSSSYLVTEASVRLTSASLARFEEICSHRLFSTTIHNVVIHTSFYDAGVAADWNLFVTHCVARLKYGLPPPRDPELVDRGPFDIDDDVDDKMLYRRLHLLADELERMNRQDYHQEPTNSYQQLAVRLHEVYLMRCEDQEHVRRNNDHITRICTALKSLSRLTQLHLTDDCHARLDRNIVQHPSHKNLDLSPGLRRYFNIALPATPWAGSLYSGYVAEPPVEMLGELFSELGKAGIRPTVVKVAIHSPADLACLQLNNEQQQGVASLVSQASELSLIVKDWFRRQAGTAAASHVRPHDEMLRLCSFTQTFLSAPTVERLSLNLEGYPVLRTRPHACMGDFLPLDRTWPKLRSVQLLNPPWKVSEIRQFVQSHAQTVESLRLEVFWLMEGSWSDVLDELRGFDKLEEVKLRIPYDAYTYPRRVPQPDLRAYIMKEIAVNPLR